jgi:hypothetical protein
MRLSDISEISFSIFQDLIPLIISTSILHPTNDERDRLLKILFNLYKKPSYNQRQILLHACLCFAKQSGPLRVHAELLPQCWENINNKLDERRCLVAEACGILTPHLPVKILFFFRKKSFVLLLINSRKIFELV